jgi:hypothetical protein
MAIQLQTLINNGVFDIELDIESPALSGYEAGIGAWAKGSDGSRWVKSGLLDTDWEEVLISTDGEFQTNIVLNDVTDKVLDENVLGRVENRVTLGDGFILGGNNLRYKTDAHNGSVTYVADSNNDVKGYDVTTISGGSYSSWSNVSNTTKAVSIGNNVTSIDNYAFFNCSDLTSITIPDSVTEIGNHVFFACASLTSITIPDSVTSIGSDAFFGCSNLTSIIIPDSVTEIGDKVFFSCSNLTSIIIPDSVTSISSSAFYACSDLISITIPDSVTSIGSDAFRYCTSLTSITIPDGVTSIGSRAFRYCTSLTTANVYVDKSVIDENSPFSNSGLTTVNLKVDGLSGWTVGSGQSVGGSSNVTVVEDF